MRRIVDEGEFFIPGYTEEHGRLRFGGVFEVDDGRLASAHERRVVAFGIASFSDAICDIRWQRGYFPERSYEEMVAHVIRHHSMDEGNGREPVLKPNDRYFALSNTLHYDSRHIIGYAVLDGSAVEPPHPVVIKELAIAQNVPDRPEVYSGLFALLLGGVTDHVDQRIALPSTSLESRDEEIVVRGMRPFELGAAALQKIGFEPGHSAGEFRTHINTMRSAYAEIVANNS